MKRLLMSLMALVAAMSICWPAMAESPVPPLVEEVMVKVSLLTFNDANITGNYSVMHAKMSTLFQEQYTVDAVKNAFTGWAGQHIDVIAAKPIVRTSEPKITKGVLMLRGYFETEPNRLNYELNFVSSDGEWKLLGFSVKAAPIPTSDAEGAPILASVEIGLLDAAK